MFIFTWIRYIIILKNIILCESAPKLGHPLFDPLMYESKQSHMIDKLMPKQETIKLFLRTNNDNNQKKKKPCHGYDFDENDCRTINSRIICGYNKNTGKVKNKESFEDMGDGCRLRGDRIECGYVTGPFLNPRRPPANFHKSERENDNHKLSRENNHHKVARGNYYHKATWQNDYQKTELENVYAKVTKESDQDIKLMFSPTVTSLLNKRTKNLATTKRYKTFNEIKQTSLNSNTSVLELKSLHAASIPDISKTELMNSVNIPAPVAKLSANISATDASLFTTNTAKVTVTSTVETSISKIQSNVAKQESTKINTIDSTLERELKTTTIFPVTRCVEIDDRIVCYFTLPLKRKL